MAASGKKKRKGKGTKKRTNSVQASMSFRESLPYLGLILLAAFASMWPIISAEFTELDDKHLILTRAAQMMEDPGYAWTYSVLSPHYKPLVYMSWVVEGKLFGLTSGVLHFNNLVLHAINSILVFFITLRLSDKFESTRKYGVRVALFSGLLFAVHPLHVESVAWAIERKDVLYTCFFFLGLLSYLKFLDKSTFKWMLFSALFFAGSLLSKSPAIVFPFILLLIDFACQRPLNASRITEKWPVMVMLVIGLFLFGVFKPHSDGNSKVKQEGAIAQMISEKPVSDVYPLTEFPSVYTKAALLGLKGTFWYAHSFIPVGLSLAYPYRKWLPAIGQGIHIFPILFLAGMIFLWTQRNKRRFLFFTHGFFLIAMGPALIRTGLGKGIFLSDRYVYLALLGLLFFIAGELLKFMNKKDWPVMRQNLIMGGLVVLLGMLSMMQSFVWRTGETLWSNVINKYPSVDYAYVNRSVWYKENNQTEKALEDLNKAIVLDQFDEHAYVHRGTLLRQLGRNEEALADLNKALERKPESQHAINGKANVLFSLGRYAEAEATYTKGLEYAPGMVTLYVNRAAARYFLRKYNEALADLDIAERMSPNYGSIYQKRTVIYMSIGDYENAVINARKTAQYEPQNHANYGDMGVALQNLGRHQEAIEALTQAIRIFDGGERYYRARAKSYEAVGNMAAAQQDINKANSL